MGFDVAATLLSSLPSAVPAVTKPATDYDQPLEQPRSTFLLHRHRVNMVPSANNNGNNGISSIGLDEDPDETEYPPYPTDATEVIPTDKYGNTLIALQALRNISEDPELSSHLLRTYIKERKRRLNKDAVEFKDLELKKYAHEAEGSGLMDLISLCVNNGSNVDVYTQCAAIIANLATLSKVRLTFSVICVHYSQKWGVLFARIIGKKEVGSPGRSGVTRDDVKDQEPGCAPRRLSWTLSALLTGR